MEIIINRCFGGFGLSEVVYKELGIEWSGYGYLDNEDMGIKSENFHQYRADERLISAVKKIGLIESQGFCSKLEIVDIPDGVEWEIDDYDGMETVHEKHRSW